jgi:hypothetical protein
LGIESQQNCKTRSDNHRKTGVNKKPGGQRFFCLHLALMGDPFEAHRHPISNPGFRVYRFKVQARNQNCLKEIDS